MSFYENVEKARRVLESHGRVSLRGLQRELALAEDALDEVVEELVDIQHVAARDGKALAWIGETTPPTRSDAVAPIEAAAEGAQATPVADAERRQLTVMFCELVGSTDLSQRLDAEELRSVVRAYQEAASAAIDRYAGHIAQYLGDGLLVYFGHPQAHDDDAERAVRAGLEILAALRALNDTLEPTHGMILAARIGIHTGAVVIGEMGGGAKSEVLALGDTTNIAARVEGMAEPDTLVITAATQRLVGGLFIVEDRGPQALKGVREPVTLYRVVQPSGVRSRLAVAAGRLTRFVGRDMEFGTLMDRWERAHDGEGQTVVVLGEAGVGKSRLVYQLHEHLAAVPHTWLECGATPYTEGTPFYPIIALVTQGLGFAVEDTAAEKLARIETRLGALASRENVALLADFLGLAPPTRFQFGPELQRRKTIDLLAQWTLSLSEAQPLVLFVEDLHWCDVSTLELLGHLIAQSPTACVLLLATARPEFAPPWPARSNLSTVHLARLTKRQARDMIATLAGTELPADTLDALVARADGVPLYVEELTKAIMESGVTHGAKAIPATLADSLMARLDRLSAAKEVAQRAAVLGREFGYPLLAATAGLDEAALRHGLVRLADAEILFARGEPPAATYTFKHALIQETAYQSLLKRTRQQLHARVAEVLEERFPERVASEPEVIARHYEQAGLVAQAITHYRRAGEGATQRSANEEAIGHLRRALDLVGALPETRERHQLELGLQMAVGVPLTAARGFSHRENEQAHTRARELALQIGESRELPRVLAELADVYLVKADLATSLEVAQEALIAAERMGAAFDLISAHYQVGSPLLWQGHFSRALQHYDHVINLYDPAEHGSLVHTVGHDRGVTTHAWAAMCHLYLGYPDRAFALREKALVLAKRLGHPFSLGLVHFADGVHHFERGEVDRARERAQEGVALAEQLRFPTWLAIGKATRGWTRAQSGEGEAGIAEIQQALVDLNQTDTRVTLPWFDFWLSDSLRKVGRHRDALDELGRGLAQTERLGNHYYDAEFHRLWAEILLDMDADAVEEAEAHFHQSLEIARRQEAKTFELRAATSLARLWQRQGKRDAARDLLAPVYAWFTEGFGTRDLKDAKALLDDLA